ncbi:MAG: electron transfer flavoprotein subunit alpha/FixB family protein [Thaumarchaeota archaeon]|nr:electron transfer flavoprotein subunit alpha/FixB family protein [Nitrososphaerota archaeon]
MSEYTGILVLAEKNNGELSESLKVLGKAREIADSLGARVEAAIATSSKADAEMLVRYGADVVYWSEHDFGFDIAELSKAIATLVSNMKPEAVIAPATESGNSVAAFLGANLGILPVFECSGLELEESNIIVNKSVYQERFLAKVTSTKPQIFTLFTKQLPMPFEDESRYGKIVEWKVDAKHGIKIISESSIEVKQKRIAVVGGRELRTAENFSVLEEFAQLIGGELCATPSAADVGLAQSALSIGPLKEINSEICIAVGIGYNRNDLMHINSETIVAVERKDDAPSMRISRIAMIGEPDQIVKLWAKELQRKS